MKFSDETLMAYAEGELDDATRGAVERAIRADPSLAAKVRQHAAMRANMFATFSPTPDEPVPPQRAARPLRQGDPAECGARRARRPRPKKSAAGRGRSGAASPPRWSWAWWPAALA